MGLGWDIGLDIVFVEIMALNRIEYRIEWRFNKVVRID